MHAFNKCVASKTKKEQRIIAVFTGAYRFQFEFKPVSVTKYDSIVL